MWPSQLFYWIKSVLKRHWGEGKFPEIGEIKEPTIRDVFGVCCGPRLYSKALELQGEDVSAKSSEDRSEDKNNGRS
jgi:hypothetical protein